MNFFFFQEFVIELAIFNFANNILYYFTTDTNILQIEGVNNAFKVALRTNVAT